MEGKLSLKKVLGYTFIGLTIIQGILGIIWMVGNITVIPNDTVNTLYNEASKSFKADDWQSLFYVFFLFFLRLAAFENEKVFTALTYLIQLGVFASAAYVLSGKYFKKKLMRRCFTIYVITLPFMLQIIFSLTPYSIRVSALMLLTAGFIHVREREKKALLLAYSGLAIVLLLGANNNICETGIYGRCERSIGFLCCYHTLWPHLSEALYVLGDDFSDKYGGEFKSIDGDSEKMIFNFGVYMEEEYPDREVREEELKRLAKDGFSYWTKDTLRDNGLSIIEYALTPYSPLIIDALKIRGTNEAGVEELFTDRVKGLSEFYLKISCLGFGVISVMAICLKEIKYKKVISTLLVSAFMALCINFLTVRGFDYREGNLISAFFVMLVFRIISLANVEED